MTTPQLIAKHLHDLFYGGNWTAVNFKDTLATIDLKQATQQHANKNTIAVLIYHVNYYFMPVLKVLQGEALVASDKFAFDCPPLDTEEAWQSLVQKTLTDATLLSEAIARLDEAMLPLDFTDPKYGSYYRNLQGLVEHSHYHLGQIVLLTKM